MQIKTISPETVRTKVDEFANVFESLLQMVAGYCHDNDDSTQNSLNNRGMQV